MAKFSKPQLKQYLNKIPSPFGSNPNPDIVHTIRDAAHDLNRVSITYTDANGMVTVRETEPYEIKDGKYWGFCMERGSIRQFNLEKITSASVSKHKFVPRFPVKIL